MRFRLGTLTRWLCRTIEDWQTSEGLPVLKCQAGAPVSAWPRGVEVKDSIRAKRDAIAQEVIAEQAAALSERVGVVLPAAMTERQRGTLEVRMMKFREGVAKFLIALEAELEAEAETEVKVKAGRKRRRV